MSKNDMDTAKERVTEWLIRCQEHNELPWEYDFKRFFLAEDQELADIRYQNEFRNDPLRFQLAYKFDVLLNNKGILGDDKDNEDKKDKKDKKDRYNECDQLASPIYQVLGWPAIQNNSMNGDTMNSFQTTFTRLLSTMQGPFTKENERAWHYFYPEVPNLTAVLTRWAAGVSPIDLKYFPAFQKNFYRQVNHETCIDLLHELLHFATLTTTIGNFTVIDQEENRTRAGRDKDYWDASLYSWKEKYDEDTNNNSENKNSKDWEKFICTYDLQGYVYSNYSVGALWDNHPKNPTSYPKEIDDFEQFYHRANQLITARGKLMTKQLIEELGLTDKLPLYKAYGLDELSANRYYDDIFTDEQPTKNTH